MAEQPLAPETVNTAPGLPGDGDTAVHSPPARPKRVRPVRFPCVICGKPFQPGQKITVEHIVPLRKGGTNVLANLGPAHAACNIGWNRK